MDLSFWISKMVIIFLLHWFTFFLPNLMLVFFSIWPILCRKQRMVNCYFKNTQILNIISTVIWNELRSGDSHEYVNQGKGSECCYVSGEFLDFSKINQDFVPWSNYTLEGGKKDGDNYEWPCISELLRTSGSVADVFIAFSSETFQWNLNSQTTSWQKEFFLTPLGS